MFTETEDHARGSEDDFDEQTSGGRVCHVQIGTRKNVPPVPKSIGLPMPVHTRIVWLRITAR